MKVYVVTEREFECGEYNLVIAVYKDEKKANQDFPYNTHWIEEFEVIE